MMQYMFKPGFFGTGAPFFMDLMTALIALLPLALYVGILFARGGRYELHRFYQWTLFLLSAAVVGWFEYGVRTGGGFARFAQQSSLPHWLLVSFLVLHIAIAVATLLWWLRTLVLAERNWRSLNLPGGYTLRHIRSGWWSAWGIFLTALTGIWVYLMLFVI